MKNKIFKMCTCGQCVFNQSVIIYEKKKKISICKFCGNKKILN